ncbi:MAG: hypothetical protein CL878_10400 [Dehalococcoidia bacterium]|nr:hypothetical protein [Dehalococcoidia bacterium]
MTARRNLADLVAGLETEDLQAQKRAGEMLLAAGVAAVPSLAQALRTGPPASRKAAAYLLGAFHSSDAVVAPLGRALAVDPEPKVRKNAAVALGKTGAVTAVPTLAAALAREGVSWVRPSLILALGAIADEAAAAALDQVQVTTDLEKEALRKALDRCSAQRRTRRVAWRVDGARQLRFLLTVPPGLERAALLEAAERGLGRCEQVEAGRLRCPPGTDPHQLIPGLRCITGLLIEAASGPPMDLANPTESAAALAALVTESVPLQHIRQWLAAEAGAVKYRLVVTPKGIRRETFRALLSAVRERCASFDLVDSPSGYDIQLVLRAEAGSSILFIRPSFVADTRFAYRHRDVGAAINPVVAACLVRLVRSPGSQMVFDPTCGSGTLLIERGFLDGQVQLGGLDVSRTAVGAARRNVHAAGLTSQIAINAGNAVDGDHWPRCDEVLANLPFGLRSRRRDRSLPQLYGAVIQNITRYLEPGGQALLYTANRKLLGQCLVQRRRQVAVKERLLVQSGGVNVGAWILTVAR